MVNQKHILITGASGGIGSAVANKLAKPGNTIWLHYNANTSKAERVAEMVASAGATPELIKGQLETDDGRNKFVEEIGRRIPRCDALINNAGGLVVYKDPEDYTEDDAASIIGLNFLAAFFLCQKILPSMISNGGGKIINISSIGVKFGGGYKSLLYSASKAALETMTVNLAKRAAGHNVQVNAIRAGVVDSEFHRFSPDKNLDSRKNLIPAKRLCLPEDVAAMVEFLSSEQSSYITGQIIAVSGGE